MTEHDPEANQLVRAGRYGADKFLSFAPLWLALIFLVLFAFFAAHIGIKDTSWIGVDTKARELVTKAVAAQKAAEEARDEARVAQATVADLRKKLATAEGAADPAASAAARQVAELKTQKTVADAELSLKSTRVDSAQKEATEARAAAMKLTPSAASAETAARVIWGATSITFCFLLVLVMIQCFREIQELASSDQFEITRRPRTKAWLVLVMAAGLSWYFLGWFREPQGVFNISGGKASQELLTIMAGQKVGDMAHDRMPPPVALPDIFRLTNFMSVGALTSLALVAFAVSAMLHLLRGREATIAARSDEENATKRAADVAWFAVLMSRTYALLQLTALALIAGVFEVFLLYLVASHHVQSTLQADVHQYARALAIGAGVVYSGMLIGIYLPMYDAQRRMNAKLGPAAPGDADSVGEPSTVPGIKSIVTLFGPVLAAFGTMLVGFVNDMIGTGAH